MALTHRTNLMPPEVPPKPAAPAPPPRRAVSQMALNSAGGSGKENLYSPDPENISPWRETSNAASTTNGGLFTGTAGRRRGLQVFSGGRNDPSIQLLLMAKMHGKSQVILSFCKTAISYDAAYFRFRNIITSNYDINRKSPDPLHRATPAVQDLSADAAPARPPQQQLQPPKPQRHPHS